MNTLYSFIDQGCVDELIQARFDRARNSKLVLSNNRVIKRAKVGQTEREYEMLTRAAERGVVVPHVKQVDEQTLSIQFLPCGETLWDYMQHGKLTKSLLAKVKSALHKMWNAGIVHGDLHINNIMISEGKIYIIDMASSWDKKVLTETFGEDDYTTDIAEGIQADKDAFITSFRTARAELV